MWMNTLVLPTNNVKQKNNVTVGGKKWSHKPHPDHRQYVAYTDYRLKTFFNETDLPNIQSKFLPTALPHSSLLLLAFQNIKKWSN